MPTNADLTAEAVKLAAALEIEITTDGLNNADLAALVKDLRAKTTDAETSTQADPHPDGPAVEAAEKKSEKRAEREAAAEAAAEKKPAFYMAEGKAVTSRKGILSGEVGEGFVEVKAEYFRGGKDTLTGLVKSGHVIKS